MVKFIVKGVNGDVAKFTRELNTYGFDENGFGEELLFPIRLNDKSGGNQETNLATYLVKYREYAKTTIKIAKTDNDKDGFFKFSSTENKSTFGINFCFFRKQTVTTA